MTVNLWIALFLGSCVVTTAEEVMAGTNASMSVTEVRPEDMYIVGLFCVLFAFMMSAIAVVIAQYAWLEDELMKEYLQKAIVHEASVLSADFSRAATTTDPVTACSAADDHAQSEYLAYVEYRALERKHTRIVMIRKQVKVFGSDFKKATGGSASDIPHAIKCDIEFAPSFPPPSDSDLDSMAPGSQEIELLVMPDFARSGLPRSQVMRNCSLSYRLPTVGLIFFLLLMAWICFFTAVGLAPETWIPASMNVCTLSVIIMAVVIVSEIISVVTCLGSGMRDGVRDIYLQGGEYLQISHDDTTISSGDDSYLRL